MILYERHLERCWVAEEFMAFMYADGGKDFKSRLFRLILQADQSNLSKIEKGFPTHVFLKKQYIKFGTEWIQNRYRTSWPR